MRFLKLPIFLIMLVLISACIGTTATLAPPDQPQEQVEPVEDTHVDEVPPTIAEPGDLQPTATLLPTDAPASATPTDVVEVVESPSGECEYKPSMEATDPSSVQLASGGVQLVEFFAFW